MFESILPHTAFNGVLPTLAADYIGIAVFIIAVLLTVGGWVMNAYKKFQESNETRRQTQQSTNRAERGAMRIDGRGDDDEDALVEIKAGGMSSKERLDALAAKRRAQMTQVRTQSGRPAATSQPDNLSAAQRAARDRAKQAYERRAELLARQRQAQEQAAQQNAQRQQTSQQAKSQSTQARAAQQQSRSNPQQASHTISNQAASASPQQQTAARRAQAQAAAASNRSRAMAESAKELAASAVAKTRRIKRGGQLEVEKIQGRATISDDSLEVVNTRKKQNPLGAETLRGALSGQSIRAAFVLKEVLDRPIALREPEDQPGMLNYK